MEDLNLTGRKKQKLSDFNLEETIGWMIGRIYQIETQIDYIISDYYKPKNEIEFIKVVLNSSIITIGGKMKILRNIKYFDKNIISKIQKISSIRNAFAHLPITESITIYEKKIGANGISLPLEIESSDKIEIMDSSGLLKTKDVKAYINEFFDLNKEIRQYLNTINTSLNVSTNELKKTNL